MEGDPQVRTNYQARVKSKRPNPVLNPNSQIQNGKDTIISLALYRRQVYSWIINCKVKLCFGFNLLLLISRKTPHRHKGPIQMDSPAGSWQFKHSEPLFSADIPRTWPGTRPRRAAPACTPWSPTAIWCPSPAWRRASPPSWPGPSSESVIMLKLYAMLLRSKRRNHVG